MKLHKLTRITAIIAATVLSAASPSAFGALVSFTGSSGSLAAEVDFSLSGSMLTVTLLNTSSSDVLDPADVLTGVFFNTTHGLTAVSASLNGSSVYYGSVVNNVGEGWQYGNPGSGLHGMTSGISAAGLDVFGDVPPNQWFYTPPVTPLDGIGYGILSAGDNSATGNTGVTDKGPLFKNSIVFTLTANSGFTLAELDNSVIFQYGTALTEPSFVGTPGGGTTVVPEPTTIIAGVLLLLPLGASTLRIVRKNRAA